MQEDKTADDREDGHPVRPVRTYVLRSGRMTEKQAEDYNTLCGHWCLPFSGHLLNYTDIFDNADPVVIEIGFGMGQATALIAEQNPCLNYIGLEVYPSGIGSLLGEIRSRELRNIRIIERDAMEVLETMIPDNSVSAFHIFFPDPWPKKRHYKRRLVQRPRTDLLASKLSFGGYLYMVTDWEDYGETALRELTAAEGLRNTCGGFAPRQIWRPETRFEKKGLKAERNIYELFFVKE